MGITKELADIFSTIAVWLNPERKERAILRQAIESAEQLLMILRKQGRYATFSQAKLTEYEIHYQKRFDQWKDGTG